MDYSAQDAIAAYRRSHDEVAQMVSGLSDDDLQRRSGSVEWGVAQVLSHLGSGSEIALRTLENGSTDTSRNQATWARWDAMGPREQAANFVVWEERLVSALEALSDVELETKQIDTGFLPFPADVRLFVDMRLSEVALHRWDVDVAFDPTAEVASYLLPSVLDPLPMVAGFLAKPIGKTGTVVVETTEPSRAYSLELHDDHTSLIEQGSPVGAASKLSLPAEAFVRLTAGRLGPEHTPSSVKLEGQLKLDDLRQLFPGF